MGRRVKPQQRFYPAPQCLVAGAGLVHEAGALGRVFVEGRQKDRPFTHGIVLTAAKETNPP